MLAPTPSRIAVCLHSLRILRYMRGGQIQRCHGRNSRGPMELPLRQGLPRGIASSLEHRRVWQRQRRWCFGRHVAFSIFGRGRQRNSNTEKEKRESLSMSCHSTKRDRKCHLHLWYFRIQPLSQLEVLVNQPNDTTFDNRRGESKIINHGKEKV